MEERARRLDPGKDTPALRPVPTAAELAEVRFGKSEGLATVHKNRVELAQFFAASKGLDFEDPDVQVICLAKAVVRHKELILLKQVERDLEERAQVRGVPYEETVFATAIAGSHDRVQKELDRLHSRAKAYDRELDTLAKRSKQGEGD